MFLHLLDEVSCSSKDGDFRRTLILLQIWNLASQNLEAVLQIVSPLSLKDIVRCSPLFVVRFRSISCIRPNRTQSLQSFGMVATLL